MITTQTSGARWNHTSDLSGDVTITIKDSCRSFTIQGDDLREFLAEYTRGLLLHRVENMSQSELLSTRNL